MGTATVSSTLRREVAEDDVLDATARTSSAAGIDAFAGARAALTHLCATLQLAAVRPLGGLLLAAASRAALLSGRRLVAYSSEMKTSIASWRAASRLLLLQESGVGRSAYGASLASTVLVECVILPTNDKCTLPTLEAWDLARGFIGLPEPVGTATVWFPRALETAHARVAGSSGLPILRAMAAGFCRGFGARACWGLESRDGTGSCHMPVTVLKTGTPVSPVREIHDITSISLKEEEELLKK
jgi:hypothetical protein